MSELKKKSWERFGQTNLAKDFGVFLTEMEDEWHVLKVKLNTPEGDTFELDCSKNPIQKLIKAKSKKAKT